MSEMDRLVAFFSSSKCRMVSGGRNVRSRWCRFGDPVFGRDCEQPQVLRGCQSPCLFINVGKEGLDSRWCLMTGSALPFHCTGCAQNRAGLGGGIRKWRGPKAGERKAWSDQGVFPGRLLPSETEGICGSAQDTGSCWHHGVCEHERPPSCLF